MSPIYGQGEAAVPFLALQQSPLLIGAGQIGAAIPMQEPAGFYYNPAQLGYFSRKNNLAVSFLPNKTVWMPRAFDISFQTFCATVGYNFGKDKDNIPLSIGLGYIHNKINSVQLLSMTYYPEFDFSSSNKGYDAFDCFSVGIGYDYYLQFNIGFSIKSFESIWDDSGMEPEIGTSKASGTTFDFGAMITTPVSKLFFDNYKINLSQNSILKPKVDCTLGYSITNIGKKIFYIDPAQADPIPRTARLGYSCNIALELFNNWVKNLNVVDYSFTAEAEDILIKNDNMGNPQYQKLFGDISIGKHLIELRGDQSVVVHRGHILRLFETIIIVSGRFDGHGYYNRKSNGFGISSEGLFKLLNASVKNPVISYLVSHFKLEYYNTNTFVGSGLETNFKGMAISFNGIEF